MRATLVIPTLNEAASIGHVLTTFRAAADAQNPKLFPRDPLDWEVLVVDGNSTDGTAEIAAKLGARVVVESRRGYGRAYQTAFAEAKGDVIATLDGDATYPVELVPELVRRLFDRNLEFLTCNRLAYVNRKAMTTEHRIGNWVLNRFLAIAYAKWFRDAPNGPLRDSQSGMWVFRREILERVRLTQDGMPFSEELKIEVLHHGLRYEEVPIAYAERWGGPPKLSSWRDGRANLMFLVRKRLDLAREAQRRATRAAAPNAEPAPR